MDGDGETAVSKGEVTCNATLDERWSMGATRGRGGARATLMLKHRGESGWRCLSLSGRKGEKGVGRSGGVCARARGGVADNTQRRRGWGRSGEQGRRAGGESGTVPCWQRLESVGWPGEKGNGPGRGKQCRAAVVN
jgi:hypothetical protein